MGTQIENYKKIAKESRIKCLQLIYAAQTSHIGSCFSVADIMAVLFEHIDLDKDRFCLSAGWKACMLYFHLWRKGKITEEELNSFCQQIKVNCSGCDRCFGNNTHTEQSKFIGLAEPVIPEIKIAGGSMGLGFPGAVGLALAKKLKGEGGKVYCLMSDGEMQIGTTWEAALIAAHHKLDNLVVFADYNKLQAMGKTNEILNIEPIGEKWETFGWDVCEIDGHDFSDIESSLVPFREGAGIPKIIIARTIKGKGWKRAENNNTYHYKAPSEEEYKEALNELS